MSSTEKANYKFTVKEGTPSQSGSNDAPAYIMCEPLTKELDIVGDNGFLFFNLKDGTEVHLPMSFWLFHMLAGLALLFS